MLVQPRVISVLTHRGYKPIATISQSGAVMAELGAPNAVRELNHLIVSILMQPHLIKASLPRQALVIADGDGTLEAHVLELMAWRQCTALIVLQRSKLGNRLLAYTDTATKHSGAGSNCQTARIQIERQMNKYMSALKAWGPKTELHALRAHIGEISQERAKLQQTRAKLQQTLQYLDSQEKEVNEEFDRALVIDSFCERLGKGECAKLHTNLSMNLPD